jgi:hypothetical protein
MKGKSFPSISDKGEVFGWGNTEYDQFRCVTDEQQIHSPIHLKLDGVGKVIDIAAGGTSCMVLNGINNFSIESKGSNILKEQNV